MKTSTSLYKGAKELLDFQVSEKEGVYLKKRIVFFSLDHDKKFLWVNAHKNDMVTRKRVDNSIMWDAGIRPLLISVSLTNSSKVAVAGLLGKDPEYLYTLTPEDIDTVIGVLSRKTRKVNIDGTEYSVRVSKRIPVVDDNTLLPAHNSWVYSDEEFSFAVANGGRRFSEVFGKRPDIFYRAGSDITKPAFEKQVLRMLVIGSRDGSYDGDFFVREGMVRTPEDSLVRGMFKTPSGSRGLIKGRAVLTPDSEFTWLDPGIDGITTVDNLKYLDEGSLNSMVGRVVTIHAYFVKEDTHTTKTKRSLSADAVMNAVAAGTLTEEMHADLFGNDLHMIQGIRDTLAGNLPSTPKWMRNAEEVTEKLIFSRERAEELLGLYEGEENQLISQGRAMKLCYGVASDADIEDADAAMPLRLRSIKVDAEYVSAGIRPVADDVLVCSEDYANFLRGRYGNTVTIVRYPISGYQSMITLRIDSAKNQGLRTYLPDAYCGVSPKVAGYLGLDGDDHIFISKPFVTFTGNEEPNDSRTNFEGLKFNDWSTVSTGVLYAGGAYSQMLIGRIHSLRAKSLGNGYPESAEYLGKLLDIAAQGAKKPYALWKVTLPVKDKPAIRSEKKQEVSSVLHALSELARRSGDHVSAIQTLFGREFEWTGVQPGERLDIVEGSYNEEQFALVHKSVLDHLEIARNKPGFTSRLAICNSIHRTLTTRLNGYREAGDYHTFFEAIRVYGVLIISLANAERDNVIDLFLKSAHGLLGVLGVHLVTTG